MIKFWLIIGTLLLFLAITGVVRGRDTAVPPHEGPELVLQTGGHTQEVLAAAWSPDGKWFVTSAQDGVLKIWDATDLRELRSLDIGAGRALAITPDGNTIIISSGPRPAFVRVKDFHVQPGEGEITSGPAAVVVHPDGRHAVSADKENGCLREWDIETGQELRCIAHVRTPTERLADEMSALAISPDGRTLAVIAKPFSSKGRIVKIVDFQSGEFRTPIFQAPDAIEGLAWSPDGKSLAFGLVSAKSLVVIDARSGAELFRRVLDRSPMSVAFTRDSKSVAGTGQFEVVICDVASRCSEARKLKLSSATMWGGAIAIHPDGTQLLAGASYSFTVFNLIQNTQVEKRPRGSTNDASSTLPEHGSRWLDRATCTASGT